MSVEWPLQVALYARLSGDPALSGLGVTVYDVPPVSEAGDIAGDFPQIACGKILPGPLDTTSRIGFDVVIRLHTRSSTQSFKECREIQSRIFDLLHKQVFAVAGFNLISLRREGSDCDQDPDRIIHGVCEYRALLETL